MDAFDSSVWLRGLLTDAPEPNRLVDEVLDGDRTVAVDAYIHDEVTRAFDVSGETTLYVADDGFTLSPADYGITTVRVENVEVPT